MPIETLEFEEPIALLLKEIDNLELQPRTDARDREIASLRRRIETVRGDLYRSLTPWQRVLVARHANRPGLEYFIEHLFTDFIEIHGDRPEVVDHWRQLQAQSVPSGPHHHATGEMATAGPYQRRRRRRRRPRSPYRAQE